MIKLVIVSDVLLYREGLAQLLSRESGIAVLSTPATRRDAALSIESAAPDVMLVDMAMPGFQDILADLRQRPVPVPVVAIGVDDAEDSVMAGIENGIAGYVTRAGSIEDLVASIECAARGELRCSPQIAGRLVRRLAALADARSDVASTRLTAREREIVGLIDRGLSNKGIASYLGIEVATVKNHIHNLLEKLQVHRRSEAAAKLRLRPPRSMSR